MHNLVGKQQRSFSSSARIPAVGVILAFAAGVSAESVSTEVHVPETTGTSRTPGVTSYSADWSYVDIEAPSETSKYRPLLREVAVGSPWAHVIDDVEIRLEYSCTYETQPTIQEDDALVIRIRGSLEQLQFYASGLRDEGRTAVLETGVQWNMESEPRTEYFLSVGAPSGQFFATFDEDVEEEFMENILSGRYESVRFYMERFETLDTMLVPVALSGAREAILDVRRVCGY